MDWVGELVSFLSFAYRQKGEHREMESHVATRVGASPRLQAKNVAFRKVTRPYRLSLYHSCPAPRNTRST